ncbi:MAG TPA: ribonuclease HII [Terriglobales bacterium]|nr:ribonuclease HII [Terriglobales bacterium]
MGPAKRVRREAGRLGFLLKVERELWATGVARIAGVDEVGVGPLAGPVVAAAVIMPPDAKLRGVDDSKKLPAPRREELAAKIRQLATAVGIGIVEVDEIDRLNIYRAALEAMRRAVVGLSVVPDHIVVDARRVPGIDLPQTSLIKGDGRCYSIAAASIVAKVTRDAMMHELDKQYPEYGFGEHMGYATERHLAALERLGPCLIHRRSFAPVREPRLPGL